MSITTRCGNCRALLSVADTLSGKKARCPKCGQGFAVLPIADNAPSPVRPATPKRTAPKRTAQAKTAAGGVRSEGRVRAETDPDDEPPRARRKRRRTNESSNHGLKLGLSIGGGGLALVVALIVIVAITRTRTQPDPVPMARPATEAPVNAQNGTGTKITLRVEINGSPPKFQGDFNKHVTEKLEIALRNLGYVPVQDGGMILQVKAQIGPNGKKISVKGLGDTGPGKQIELERIRASLVLTNSQGSEIWKNERQFSTVSLFFHGDPAGEMREEMWRSFDAWADEGTLSTMK